MKSKYNSFCIKCKKKIRIGDEITKDESLGKWVHENCPNGNPFSNAKKVNEFSVTEEGGNQSFNTDFVPNKYQEDIFEFIRNGKGNGVVEAVAGSGKTTTIVKALEIVPSNKRIAFLAFNKHIAKELKKRAPEYVHVSTVHSLGLSIVKKLEEFKEIDEDKLGGIMDSFWDISKEVDENQSQRTVNRTRRTLARKVVALCKVTLVDYNNKNAVYDMLSYYGIDGTVTENGDNFMPDVIAKLPDIMKACLENTETIDFEDMIWLPVVHERLRKHFEKFEYLFIDEAQDLNNCQIEFIKNSVWDVSRIIAVGDRKQSLYGFRGADVNAIPRLIQELNATVLPLSISYRCPRVVIEKAQEIVPQIEASDTAIDGKFYTLEYDKFLQNVNPGDMVICRTNAPLVKPAFECIRTGKKAVIRGRDIGSSLVNFIERFQATNLNTLEIQMSEYTQKEYMRLLDKGKELQAEMVIDKTDTIRTVAKECTSVPELVQKLQMLFSDSNIGVVFSSVHRAKGLEAERVFVLRPELMPHPKAKQGWELVQEDNTLYVALTRSKNELCYVIGGDDE